MALCYMTWQLSPSAVNTDESVGGSIPRNDIYILYIQPDS